MHRRLFFMVCDLSLASTLLCPKGGAEHPIDHHKQKWEQHLIKNKGLTNRLSAVVKLLRPFPQTEGHGEE